LPQRRFHTTTRLLCALVPHPLMPAVDGGGGAGFS
jgi:hypothetical protein